jgi:hypothetical protein
MPLNTAQLVIDLIAAGDKASEVNNKTPKQRRDEWAQEVGEAMERFVKSGTVTVTVTTTGTATNHTGTGTGNMT